MAEMVSIEPRLVRASAGTGKTRDLSTRYISLLAQGETPDKILATTFTRKAAAEIRERIFLRLSQAAQSSERANELGSEIEQRGFMPQDAAGLLKRLTENQHRLMITTLDALFISMAQSFSLELSLPLHWQVASDQDTERMREVAINSLLEHDDGKSLLEVVGLLRPGELPRAVHRDVVDSVVALYRFYLASDLDAWSWLESDNDKPAESLELVGEALQSYSVPLTKAGTPDQRITKLVASLLETVAEQDWKAFGKMSAVNSVLDGQCQFYGKILDDSLVSSIGILLLHARYSFKIRHSARLTGVRELLALYDKAYRAVVRRMAMLTFDDVKQSLQENQITGNLEPLYYRLDSRINHLLLDEFQDTSMSEWRILTPIADEVLSRPAERSFFCVGDIKQAIYGWRGGVAEIFGSIEDRWTHLRPETKHVTYRCAPAIVSFVNDLFGSLESLECTQEYIGAIRSWCQRFEPHLAAQSEKSGQVRVHETVGDSSPIDTAVDLVANLHNEYPFASIGVLVRRNKTVSELLARFSESHPALTVSEEGAVRITDSPLVRALMSLLIAIDQPADSLAVYHVLQSGLATTLSVPLVENAMDAHWCEDVRDKLLSQGYGPTMSQWSDCLLPQCSQLDAQRIEQLLEQAYLYDERRTPKITEFVALVENMAVELPTESSIRVMSLHKSKGLEFDIVVLPELETSIRVNSQDVLVGQESPIGEIQRIALSAGGGEFERKLIPELGLMYEAKQAALVTESLSLLYVGVTRPRQILQIVLPPGEVTSGSKVLSAAKIISEQYTLRSSESVIFGQERVFIEKSNDERTRIRVPVNGRGQEQGMQPLESGRMRLDRVSPSKLQQQVRLLDPRVTREGRQARERGTALHLLFESVEWIETFSVDSVQASALFGQVDEDRIAEITEEFSALLCNRVISTELSKERFGKEEHVELRREQSFAVRDGEQLVSGVIDRLVVGYQSEEPMWAEITDFKSDKLTSPEVLKEKIERYEGQMKLYVQAVRALLGAPVRVVAKLLFLDGPTVITLDVE